MEVEDAAEPTPSIPTGPKVLWSNPNARTNAKSTRRGRRNRQKLRRNEGAPQASQDRPYNNVNGPTDTTTSFTTIPDITLTSATPGEPSGLAPLTASNSATTGHLKPPTLIPRPRRSRRFRAKANVSAEPKRRLTALQADQRSSKLDRLHRQLGRHESNVRELEEYVSSQVAEDPSLGPDYRAEQLANARAEVQSYRAAIEKMVYARHLRPMTEKERVESERLVELHQRCYRREIYEKGADQEWSRAQSINPEAARSIGQEKQNRSYKAEDALWDEISKIKREWGFDRRDCETPDDPANGTFSTKMLRESRWSREEKLACAQHYVARWEAELRIWERRVSESGGGHWNQEVVKHSISSAQGYLEQFRSKVDELSDPKWEEKKEMIGGGDKIEGQPKTPTEMDVRMMELMEGVERL